MKSLLEAKVRPSVAAWNPPELGVEPSVQQPASRTEQALAIFRNEDGAKKELKSALHAKTAEKNFATWQPGLLGTQTETVSKYEWSFLDVRETPIAVSHTPPAQRDLSEVVARREVLRTENEASLILETARRQAEEIILSAQMAADDALLQSQAEIDEQKKEGYQQGRNEAHAELEQTLNAVRKMSAEVQAWRDELFSQGEEILVGMLKDISRKMFGEGVKLDAEALRTHLNQVMENARGLGVLKIFLNPNDAKLLDPSWGEQQMLSLGEQVKIIPTGNIIRGGCLIKGNIGTVDGRVETQLETILKTFEDADQSAG
jgi:flagellar assembly protein FliH